MTDASIAIIGICFHTEVQCTRPASSYIVTMVNTPNDKDSTI